MSRDTVKTHLSHIYARLGVANRGELAAEALNIRRKRRDLAPGHDGGMSTAMTSGVPATMLITVSARGLVATEKPEMGFRNPFAEQLVESLGRDSWQYCTFPPNLISAVFRSVFFDRITRAF